MFEDKVFNYSSTDSTLQNLTGVVNADTSLITITLRK